MAIYGLKIKNNNKSKNKKKSKVVNSIPTKFTLSSKKTNINGGT